jgi:hypothetical protein
LLVLRTTGKQGDTAKDQENGGEPRWNSGSHEFNPTKNDLSYYIQTRMYVNAPEQFSIDRLKPYFNHEIHETHEINQ